MLALFLEAYKAWPPESQLIFAMAALFIGAVLLFFLTWWLLQLVRDTMYYGAVLWRGWPPEEGDGVAPVRPAAPQRPNWNPLNLFNRMTAPIPPPDGYMPIGEPVDVGDLVQGGPLAGTNLDDLK